MTSANEGARYSLDWWLDVYSKTHMNPVNIAIHKICVPVIFLVTVGLLDCVPLLTIQGFAKVTLLWPIALFSLVFYGRLRKIFALVFVLVLVAIVSVGRVLLEQYSFAYIGSLIAVFVVAWIGQFIGHKIEGAKPAFLQDLLFLLIGPLWIALKAFRFSRKSETSV